MSKQIVNAAKVTKAEIEEFVCRYGFTKEQAETAVLLVIGAFKAAITAGSDIEIRGFLTIKTVITDHRITRNPRTGEKSLTLPKKKLRVKMSKELTKAINA